MTITLTADGLLKGWSDAMATHDEANARRLGQTLYDWCRLGHEEPIWKDNTQRAFFLRWMNRPAA